ncbi:MAG: acetolactate decarboxylase [bacterium]
MYHYLKLGLLGIIIAISISSCICISPYRETLYQTSTINALLEGVYDGDILFTELAKHGDFGIGTFNALDGEMIAVSGKFYQVKADGKVYPVSGTMHTPFAVVTYFGANTTLSIRTTMDFQQLEQYLDTIIPTPNIFYAVKIDGRFAYLKTRSVPKQTPPYLPLAEVVKSQPVFELRQVNGTIVGFWVPAYAQGINVPGYHFHFISDDRTAGGHLLDCQLQSGTITLDYTPELYLVLPQTSAFYHTQLIKNNRAELDKVEKSH